MSTPAAPGALISSIDLCIRQVSDHLQTEIDRVLESVLMLRLLVRSDRYPAIQDRLLAFLRERHRGGGNTPLDTLLLDAVLATRAIPPQAFVDLAPTHLGTPRKRWMLSTCLALSGATLFRSPAWPCRAPRPTWPTRKLPPSIIKTRCPGSA